MYASALRIGDSQPAVADIAHHPDHLPRFGVGPGQQQALADGRFAAEQFPCECLVDHQHRGTLRPVEPGERAPAPDTKAHRVEVAGTDDVDGSLLEVSPARSAAGRRLRGTGSCSRQRTRAADARKPRSLRHPEAPSSRTVSSTSDSWKRRATARSSTIDSGVMSGRNVAPGFRMRAVITLAGVVAAIDGDEPHEAAQQQPRSYQQHEGQGHLGHGQRRTRPVGAKPPETAGGLRVAHVQRPGQVDPRPLEGRDGAEQQPRRDRQSQG